MHQSSVWSVILIPYRLILLSQIPPVPKRPSASPYETEEGCLSLLGAPRKTTRYKTIRVKYQDDKFQWKTKSYSGFTAQIIQHEIDHCNGILI